MSCTRRRFELGLTMIEVMVSTIILSVIVAMASWLVWSSAKHVSTAEVRLQMDMQIRELMGTLTRELRQTRLGQVKAVDSTTIPVLTPALLNAPATPGPIPPAAVASAPFYAIRFKIPGESMDITQSNAGNFDLAAYVADKQLSNPANPDWTTEIQYWWEPDAVAGEGVAGTWAENNAPDGVDNNNNGVVDEGVIKRMETTFTTAGALKSRTVSTVCRNVQIAGPTAATPAYWSGKTKVGLTFLVLPSTPDANGVNQSANRIQVTVSLERPDPENAKRTVFKQLSAVIEMRNF